MRTEPILRRALPVILVFGIAAPAQAHMSKRAYVQKAVRQAVDVQAALTPTAAADMARTRKQAVRRWEAIDARWDEAHAPAPVPVPEAAPASYTPTGSVWDAVAACEDNDDPAKGPTGWATVTTGNGYYFALQFAPSTWLAYGGTQAELDAGVAPSRARLIEVAEAVLAGQGPGAWPNCFP